jgi:adenosylcobinamide-GDP ribazoletransferase
MTQAANWVMEQWQDRINKTKLVLMLKQTRSKRLFFKMTEMKTSPSVEQEPPHLELKGWRGVLRDLAQMVRFYSRLPVPKLWIERDAHALPNFRVAPRMVAVAGIIIGLPTAITLFLAASVGLPNLVVATLAVTISILCTGAFHEDGLADTFDGLAGGATPERRLDIMKDSRIGAFGGSALILGILLRVSAIAGLLEETDAWSSALLLVVAASLSRSFGLTPLAFLPNARPGGFSSSVGRPDMAIFVATCMLSFFFAGAITAFTGISFVAMIGAIILALVPVALISWWSAKTIHGQTGDIAGASQQVAEIAFYIGLLVALGLNHG